MNMVIAIEFSRRINVLYFYSTRKNRLSSYSYNDNISTQNVIDIVNYRDVCENRVVCIYN